MKEDNVAVRTEDEEKKLRLEQGERAERSANDGEPLGEQAENSAEKSCAAAEKEHEAEEQDYKKVRRPNVWKRFVKRAFDLVASGAAILLLSPFFLLFTPIVAIAMKGNPFFCQERAGKDGKPFKVIKYRSMTNAKDKDGNLLPNDQRITKFGKLLRKLSLDELPQLFNIFAGQMSVVGPRPLHMIYNDRYNAFQKQRLLVKPGLTGLAQVSGRNALSWEQKFEKDVLYIEKCGFFYDCKIIFLTFIKVLKRESIDSENKVGTDAFLGTKNDG